MIDEANPYLSPLLDPPTLPTATPAVGKASEELHSSMDRPKGQGGKEAVKQLLSDMSMADAVQCINQFLRTDKRYTQM